MLARVYWICGMVCAALQDMHYPNGRSLKAAVREVTQALEQEMITDALETTRWNITKSAKLLGVSRKGLQLKLHKYGFYGDMSRDIRRAQDPRVLAAHRAVHQATKSGLLAPPDMCSICGFKAVVIAHHSDYSKPLEVDWPCRSCHTRLHNELRKEFPT